MDYEQLHKNAAEVLVQVGDLIKRKCSEDVLNVDLTDLSNLVGAYESLYNSISK